MHQFDTNICICKGRLAVCLTLYNIDVLKNVRLTKKTTPIFEARIYVLLSLHTNALCTGTDICLSNEIQNGEREREM